MSKNLHAAALGAKGGKAGVGASKRRSPAHYRKMVRARRTLSPAQASTTGDFSRLEARDYMSVNGWILVNDLGVTLSDLPYVSGRPNSGLVTIPHDEFLKMVHWFLEPQRERDAGEVKS